MSICRGVIVITPDAYLNAGKIINAAEEQAFTITNLKMARRNKQEAERLLEPMRGNPKYGEMVGHLCSDLVIAVEVLAENCVKRVQEFVGSMQNQYGSDPVKCAVVGSDSAQNAAR